MPPECIDIDLHGEQLRLHPQRAVVWSARATLVIADPAAADLQRLTELLAANACTWLIVLGDFLQDIAHAGDSFLDEFRVWRQAHGGLTVDIVVGNPDRRESAQVWQQIVGWHTRPLIEPPFVLAHEPAAHPEGYVLAGHLHPVMRLRRRNGAGRVPVFWQRHDYLVLPSFGSMTSGTEVAAELGDRLFAAGPERVMPLPVGVP